MPFDTIRKKDQRVVLGAFKTGHVDIQLSRNRVIITALGEDEAALYKHADYERNNPDAPLSVVFRDEGRRRKIYAKLYQR